MDDDPLLDDIFRLAGLPRRRWRHTPAASCGGRLRRPTVDAPTQPRLDEIAQAWELSLEEIGVLFGIDRDIATDWLHNGAPRRWSTLLADLALATDLLLLHMPPEQLGWEVRQFRPWIEGAEAGGTMSIFELAAAGATTEMLVAAMRLSAEIEETR